MRSVYAKLKFAFHVEFECLHCNYKDIAPTSVVLTLILITPILFVLLYSAEFWFRTHILGEVGTIQHCFGTIT